MANYAKSGEVMYHCGLTDEMIERAKYVLLPGDPGRVEGLAKNLDVNARFVCMHREYCTWLAHICGKPVAVMSSGMGGPAVSFAVEELARLGVKNFIRVGTTGSLQEKLNLGDIIINNAAVRLEGASKAYAPPEFPAVADLDLTLALRKAAQELGVPHMVGIGVSTDSFWPGQERYDSFMGHVPCHLRGSLKQWQELGCTNYEMEAATLFTLASAFGLRAAALCAVVAKRTDSEAVAPPEIYRRGEKAFQAITKLALTQLLTDNV